MFVYKRDVPHGVYWYTDGYTNDIFESLFVCKTCRRAICVHHNNNRFASLPQIENEKQTKQFFQSCAVVILHIRIL